MILLLTNKTGISIIWAY